MEVETIRVQGNDLVENCVYNIYQTDRNVNDGVCLVVSKNNRNNRNKIKLRKLIGNNELSLNKSEIYGERPVNYEGRAVDLRGADLHGADLHDADLRSADLTIANLSGANLRGAYLCSANLCTANLRGAILSGADLSGAILSGADLSGADLSEADLSEADLTDADLREADLTDAIISRKSLSECRQEQIFLGEPKYIEDLSEEELSQEILRQEQRRQELRRQELLGQQIINLNSNNHNNSSNENNVQRMLVFNNNIPPPNQQIQTRITIPENLLNPVKNSKNSCPNFNELYEFIMRQNLSGIFFFKYEGPNRNVIDVGGPKRDVFDKILPAYTKKFFKEIEDNENYVILRESVDMDTLIRETEQLILLARASETKIFLKIDPILLSLLEKSQPYIKYFTNNKRNSFSNLYRKFNQYIVHSNNNNQLLKYENNKREFIKIFKNQKLKNEEFKKKLEQEIRFRIFAITRGFTNMEQFNKMAQFIRKFYYRRKSFITCKLKFDVETIIKRIKLYKMIKINNFDEYTEELIPLEQYVRLSQNKSVLILNRADDVIMNYPYLIPFLNFILGPESSDDDRKLFVIYVSGSSSYTGELKIYLSYITRVKAGREFHSSTCYKYLELFKNKTQNRHSITVDAIRLQLSEDTGFGRA